LQGAEDEPRGLGGRRRQGELAALRAALEAQAEQARIAEQKLQETLTLIEGLDRAQREANERMTAELAQMRETIDGPPMLGLENRLLRIEKQVAQQADDMQGAVAGLVARIDGAQRPRKSP